MTTYGVTFQRDKPRHRQLLAQLDEHLERSSKDYRSEGLRILLYDGVAANEALAEAGLSFSTDDRDEEYSAAKDEFIREAIREKAERESNTSDADADADNPGVVSY